MNRIKSSGFCAELLLVLAAIVWGFAFVAQKAGMEDIGPMAFNGIRFLLGSISLFPLIWYYDKKGNFVKQKSSKNKELWKAGFISGLVLFVAASVQQIGIVYTTAGNAGFITSMYVILVPVFGLAFKQRVNMQTWIGVVIALIGLYFLSVSEGLVLVIGDLLVFGSAFFWAAHVLLASYYAPKVNVIRLAAIQFGVTGILSLIISFFTESYGFENIYAAAIPLLYGGLMSVGLGFTLQLVAQQKANPTHAAIILTTEAVFAAIGGWLILNEHLTTIETVGAGLMLTGVVLSQLKKKI